MKRVSVGLLIVVVIVSIIFAFLVFVQQEKLEQEVLDARATAVSESNSHSTSEAERGMVAGTAVALATTLHEQQIEATAVAETAVANVTTLEEALAESQTQQAILESEFYKQQQNALAYKLALSSFQVRESSYPDWQLSTLLAVEAVNHMASTETTAALANSLELLSDLAMNLEGVHPDATELVFSQDGNSLLAWGWGKEAVLWDVSTGEQLFSTPIKGEGRGLSSDGCFFAVNNWPTLDIIDMCRGETAFTPPTRFGSAVAFSPNNQLLAYSTTVVPDDSEDTSTWWEFFAIQNLQSGEEVIKEKIIPVEERRSADYEALAFNADGSLVAGANFDEVHVRDFSQGKGTFTAMDLSENGRFLAVSEGQIIHVWNQQTDDLIASVTTALSVDKIQFSTDGKYLATRSRDEYRQGFIEVWNTEDWHSILSIFHSFGDFAFSPDSQVIAVADGSKVAQVLSLPDGQEINSIQHEEKIEQVVFSADGKQLAFRGWWETAGLWYWNASDLIAEACSRLARNLSTDEWQTYVGSEPYHRTCPELRIP